MSWKDRATRNSPVRALFSFAWLKLKMTRFRHLVFLFFLVIAIQVSYMYAKSALIVYPTTLPESVKKLGYDPTTLTLSAVASLPDSVRGLRQMAINSVIGAPDSNGVCYPSGWENEEFLKKISISSQSRPNSTSEFVEFKFSEGGISFLEAIDTVASLFSLQKTKLIPSVTEVGTDFYSLRLDVKHGGNFFRATEQYINGADALETGLLNSLMMISYPEDFSVTLRGRSDIDLDSVIKAVERIGKSPEDAFFLKFAKLNAMEFGRVTSADVDSRRLLISGDSRLLLDEMNKLGIVNNELELRLLLNIASVPIFLLQNSKSLSPAASTFAVGLATTASEQLSSFRDSRDLSQAELASIFGAQTFLNNTGPTKTFSSIVDHFDQVASIDQEFRRIAVEYAILAAASSETEYAKMLLDIASRSEGAEVTRADARYALEIRLTIAEMMISGSDLTEQIVNSPEFYLYPCVSSGFLQDLIMLTSRGHIQADLRDIERGYLKLESEELKGFHFYNSWGSLYSRMNMHNEAIKKFRDARDFAGDIWWSLLNEGNSFLELGDFETAEALYRESLELTVIPQAVFGLLGVFALQDDAEEYFRVLLRYEDTLLHDLEYGPLYSRQASSVACRNDMNIPDSVSLTKRFPVEIDVLTCEASLPLSQTD